MKRAFISSMFVVCMLMMSACCPCCEQPINSEHSMTQEYSQPDKPIEITTGQEFTLKLVSNPTTGYGWQLSKPLNENVVAPATNTYIPKTTIPQMVGSGGHEIWTFRAVGKGNAEIIMQYARPWETDVPPIETNIFNVIVK